MAVTDLIADARAYTTDLAQTASQAIDSVSSSVAAIGYVVPSYSPAATPAPPAATPELTAPNLTDVLLELPAEPADDLVFQDIPDIQAGTAPEFTAVAPAVNLPTAPAAVAEFLDQAPVVDTGLVFPDPPAALSAPPMDAPTLTDHAAPIAPQIVLPGFDATAPTDLPAAPGDLQESFAAAYKGAAPSTVAMLEGYVDSMLAKYNPRYHSQMEAIESQLSKYLAGGTGLNPAAENAIYERARDKNNAEAMRTRDLAYRDAAGRGFTLPTGALLSATQQARQAGADNNARAASEIVVLQAEMEQKNLQFAVTTSANLRTALLNAALGYHQNLISINGQALEYAKTVLNAIIETYNTAVKAYSVRLEGYKAEVLAYETRLKVAMASIDLYRAEIDALQALVSVDRAKVEVYKARIDTLNSLANVYRSQIDAVHGRASLERLKLDLFGARVQAYSARVQAKNAEWQGYTSAINGEAAKAQIFSSQVQAYSGRVNAYRAEIDAKAEAVRAKATANDARARQYAARMEGYRTVVQARGEVARTKLENQRQQVVSFQSQAQVAVANAQVKLEHYRVTSDVAIRNASSSLQAQLQHADSVKSYGQTLSQLGLANAQVYSGMAGAALAGMNTLAAQTLAE